MMGRIFDLQRFSTHDGPGIRTTVFLKGCPLRCLWCHNPEGISPDLQLSFLPSPCVGCGACRDVCPNEGHRIERNEGRIVHVLERSRCRRCGSCAAACVSGALEQVGRDLSVADVLGEVLQDRVFYGLSGGGLTLSGGEPLLQADFTAALLRAAKDQGIACCLETSGYARWPQWEGLVGLVDLFLFDYKETDPQRHVEFTGVSNALILENLRALYARGAKIALRCPIIPGCNDRPDHFAGIAALAREMPALEGIELLPYHPLGTGKSERLGAVRPTLVPRNLPDPALLQEWLDWFQSRGVRVSCRQAPPQG
jgi:pyruvate formate lyase activating enzyme